MNSNNDATSKRPVEDTQEARYRIFQHLKSAFGLIKSSMANEFYMPAYVTAFSIIEDRIFAMYVVAFRVNKEGETHRDFGKSILVYAKYLLKYKHIDDVTFTQLTKECDSRNKRIHGAMWRLNEYNEENTQKVVTLARVLTNFRKAQSKKHGTGFGPTPKTKK
jgi:hypothetical protein